MRRGRQRTRYVALAVVMVVVMSGVGLLTPPAAMGQSQPGFDGSTIKVSGFGIKQVLPTIEVGARARIDEFNRNDEIKGIIIEFGEFADDKSEAATSLSEVRRLVAQEQVFALVPDASLIAPRDYITQQKVPTFGPGFGPEYCTPKPDKTIWFFSAAGCQTSDQPTFTRDAELAIQTHVRKATGKKKPTVALISSDDATGVIADEVLSTQFEKNGGWDLVYHEAAVAQPAPGDFTPYVQALASSNDGRAPDFIRCASGLECLRIYSQLRAGGYEGEYEHNLYTDALVAPFEGSIVAIPFTNLNAAGVPALDDMKAAVERVKPGTKLDSGVLYGYTATDMFVEALKLAAENGKSGITRANVQKAASTMTWEIEGLSGPTRYPASTVAPTPMCREIVKSDGTTWQTVVPYTCTMKGYKLSG